MRAGISTVFLTVLLAGCRMGPNYKRPTVAIPSQYRGVAAQTAPESVGDQKFFDLFPDETLKRLVTAAAAGNFDLRISAERVEQARAQLGIVRANEYPFLDMQGGFQAARSSSIGSFVFLPRGTTLKYSFTQINAALSWELDLWGRLRRLTESARAQYLASEEGRRGVLVSLVAEVLNAYFQLIELDSELKISEATRDIAIDNLRLVTLRRDRGVATGLDVHQAEQLLYTATARIAAVERARTQTENALSLLLGSVPGPQPRGADLKAMTLLPELPAGLPSALLERRPDIRQAEQQLVSANAEVGAAKALYFPRISLTALAGGQSRALSQIATAPARVYQVAPSALQPVFHAGQIRNQIRLTEAQKRELLINYQKTIYTALREVSDALVGQNRTSEQREQQEQLVRALDETVRLSTLRYKGGLDSYLQVIVAQRNLFEGQLALAQLQLLELQSGVQLYRALGGGWQ